MDFNIYLKDSEVEVLKAVAEASGDSIDEWLHSCVIGGLQSDIDLYFGHSEAIKEKLGKKLGLADTGRSS
jgi:hypothetical protein